MAIDWITIFKTYFIDNIDYTITYIAITIILFFYGTAIVRGLVRKTGGKKALKFIIFGILTLFGLNLLLVFLTNLILSIADTKLKWIVIGILLFLGFYKFEREIVRD